MNSSSLPPLHPNTFKINIAKKASEISGINYLPKNYSKNLLNTILKDELKNTPKLKFAFLVALPYFFIFLVSISVFLKAISFRNPKDTSNEVEIVEVNNSMLTLNKHSVYLRNYGNRNVNNIIVKVQKVPNPSQGSFFVSFSHCASVELTRLNTPNVSQVRLTTHAMQSKFEVNGNLVDYIDVPIHTNVLMIPYFRTQEEIFVWKSFVDNQPIK
jgi:hypothetical protein